jgi:hypothetical protein
VRVSVFLCGRTRWTDGDEPEVADAAAASEKMLRILESCMVMVCLVD